MSPASYQTAPPRDAAPDFEPVPGPLPRAGNGTRTRDPNLGKVVLYQLSYSRESGLPTYAPYWTGATRITAPPPDANGGEGDRTPDLVNAIHALSQLSYAPAIFCSRREGGRSTAR